MAEHHGNEGVVKIGVNTVAEVQSWSYDESDVDVQEVASIGDTEVNVVSSGIKAGGGTLECMWDETDTNGQEALTIGASVALELYPEGSASGDVYYAATAAIITAVSIATAVRGMVTRSFTFRGVLAKQTVV